MADTTQDRLLDAMMEIAAAKGLERVTVREVAAQAGVSLATVQYYCRTKDEMLVMAFRHVMGRIAARAAARQRSGPVAVLIRATLHEFLPLDDLRRKECRVYLAFAARAAVTPSLAEVQRELLGGLRKQCADAFRLAQERDEGVGEFDAEEAAASTSAMIDGLLLHLLTDPHGLTKRLALDVLDNHLRRYLVLAS